MPGELEVSSPVNVDELVSSLRDLVREQQRMIVWENYFWKKNHSKTFNKSIQKFGSNITINHSSFIFIIVSLNTQKKTFWQDQIHQKLHFIQLLLDIQHEQYHCNTYVSSIQEPSFNILRFYYYPHLIMCAIIERKNYTKLYSYCELRIGWHSNSRYEWVSKGGDQLIVYSSNQQLIPMLTVIGWACFCYIFKTRALMEYTSMISQFA